jgi:hypothetical protein
MILGCREKQRVEQQDRSKILVSWVWYSIMLVTIKPEKDSDEFCTCDYLWKVYVASIEPSESVSLFDEINNVSSSPSIHWVYVCPWSVSHPLHCSILSITPITCWSHICFFSVCRTRRWTMTRGSLIYYRINPPFPLSLPVPSFVVVSAINVNPLSHSNSGANKIHSSLFLHCHTCLDRILLGNIVIDAFLRHNFSCLRLKVFFLSSMASNTFDNKHRSHAAQSLLLLWKDFQRCLLFFLLQTQLIINFSKDSANTQSRFLSVTNKR